MSAAISETTMRLAASTMALLAAFQIPDGGRDPFVCVHGLLLLKPGERRQPMPWVSLTRSDFKMWCSQIAKGRQ